MWCKGAFELFLRTNFWVKFVFLGSLVQCVVLVVFRLTTAHHAVANWNMISDVIAARGMKSVILSSTNLPVSMIAPNQSTVVVSGSASKNASSLSSVTLDVRRNMTIPEFLKAYTEYCERAFRPPSVKMPLCDCVPRGLVGRLRVKFDGPPQREVELSQPMLRLGGTWKPADCTARQRVVIIIPYRDREAHLLALLNHLHPILQRQQLDYRIMVVEQVYPDIFNKATMMNIGFTEANKLGDFDCYIFHDVDVLAEDDRNFYTCAHHPRHVGAYLRKFRYNLKYNFLFGAATAFTREQFKTVNGFSNEFYGWGGEDDDMSMRVETYHYTKVRYPRSIARYRMIKHKRDESNPYNKYARRGMRHRPRYYPRNGLSNLKYSLREVTLGPLYTLIRAEIPQPKRTKNLQGNWPKWKVGMEKATNAQNDTAKLSQG